jgi:hypothetical protein
MQAAATPSPIVFPVVPVVRYRAPQTLFRGTRLLTGLVLGFAGLLAVGFAGVAVPVASALGLGRVDPGLMDALARLAPYLLVLGGLHLLAAVGVWRDRAWGYRLATWMVALGVLATTAGLVVALAGRDPLAITDASASMPSEGVGILAWTLLWYGVAGWGIQRVLAARAG